ncbi:MAG: iron chaperone [Candidatus Dormibacteria bacterium]
MSAPSSVEEYIAEAPPDVRSMLTDLRETIRTAAPEADERLSYGMPYYHLGGRLTYFQAHAHHIGLYAFSPEEARAVGLEQHMSAKATLRFPFDEPLPLTAIGLLIRNRVKTIRATGSAKSSRKL